mmetsp:Transcript_49022/g.138725  ORF Transcript_49022/g.138725 Transcript_49022/m.138725 type:complete len:134 (-) Transcript_49022:1319-1720(-)
MADRPAWRPVTSADGYRISNEFGRSHSHSVEGTNPLHAHRDIRAQSTPPSIRRAPQIHASDGDSHSRPVLAHGESGLFHRESVIRYNAVKTGIKPRSIIWHYQKFHAYGSCMLFFCFLTSIIITPFLLLPDMR